MNLPTLPDTNTFPHFFHQQFRHHLLQRLY